MVTPTKKTKSPIKAATSTTKAKKIKSSEDSIAKGIGGLSIGTTKLFSAQCIDPIFIRPRVPHNEWGEVKDYTEVDIMLGQAIPEDNITVTLSPDGRHIYYKKATHEMFGEADRMKLDVGKKEYRADNPRVLAHDDTCQEIRTMCKAVDGKFWPTDEERQIIELHDKCRGMIMKKFNIYPTKYRVNGVTQFTMIVTLRIELENQRVRREKKGKVEVHGSGEVADEVYDFDEGEESDAAMVVPP